LLIGCLHRLLGLAPRMQKSRLNQAPLVGKKFSFLLGLAATSALAIWDERVAVQGSALSRSTNQFPCIPGHMIMSNQSVPACMR
jgi:hypothetical protein